MPSSTLLGSPTESLSLTRAVDALSSAARLAGRPGLVWLAGAWYPGIYLNVALVTAVLGIAQNYTGVELPYAGDSGQVLELFFSRYVLDILPDHQLGLDLVALFVLLPVLLCLSRLVVGLAKTSDPDLWVARGERPPFLVESGVVEESADDGEPRLRLRTAWRAGKRLGVTTLGIWLMLVGLLFGAGLVVIGPVVVVVRAAGVEDASAVLKGLLVPPLLLLFLYAVVLMVINQLALHSLAHNQRGVSSALTHAWRLVRTSPLSVFRATMVDFVLSIAIVAIESVVRTALQPFNGGVAALVLFGLYGFAGVTRAGYWARSYRALGGLSAADRVPGLS